MKRIMKRHVLTWIMALALMLQAAGCGAAGGPSQEDLREKLLLAYQYLENMEYDNALDAFAAVIEIDEKIPEAYVGMARAYSAKGDQGAARETAAKGKEVTEAPYFEDLERMYGKVQDNEDTLKEIAELLREGEEKIPGELEESKSGLLSETLDKLWEKLDGLDIYDVIGDETLVYPVDPEKGIYLVLYPDGRFYLGEVRFVPYSELLAQLEETTEEGEETEDISAELPFEDLVIPVPEGHGIQAGFDDYEKIADLYIGEWKNYAPYGENGLYVYQYLPDGPRFVYRGTFLKGSFGAPSAVFGSTEDFLQALLEEETSVEVLYRGMPLTGRLPFVGEDPSERGIKGHINGGYNPDFENRELMELIDQGKEEEVIRKRRQARSPIPIDGDLIYINRGLDVHDYDVEHGLYMVSAEGKGLDIPYAILDRNGNVLFQTYEDLVWFTSAGFSGLVIMDEGTENPYSSNIYEGAFGDGPDGDVWQVDFDWNGNETGRNLVGKFKNVYSYSQFGDRKGVSIYSGDATGPGAGIRAERTDSGILVTDLDGNSLGTISVEDSSAWNIGINGKMLEIKERDGYQSYLFLVQND